MTPALSPIVREAIAAHGMLTKLGFSNDDLFLRPTNDRLFVTIRRSGKEFNLAVGKHTMDVHRIVAEWTTACAWWNALPQDDRAEFVDASMVRRELVQIVAALQLKGFALNRSDA